MFERGGRLGVVIALVALVVGGCALSTATSPEPSSDTGNRPPAAESPSNFASPTDLFHRYPTMRRQEL
jgi:hypothetical protein